MKLLNLWPQEEVVYQPAKRFLLETVFALLVVVAITLASWLWFTWRLNHAMTAHQVLQTEWAQLKKQSELEDVAVTRMPRALRQMVAGELDWMGELSQWTQGGRVRWLSAKNISHSLLLEGIAQDSADIDAVAGQIRARYPTPPLSISEITGVMVDGQKWWRFSMKVEGVDGLYRWALPLSSVSGSGQQTPPPSSGSTGEAQ